MLRIRTLAGAAMAGLTIALPGLTIAGITAPAGAAAMPGAVVLTGSAAPFAGHIRPNGRVAAGTRISIQVWLRPRMAAAARFASAVSAPGSAQFHHYLRPSAYTARFGPSRAETAKVETWLRATGFMAVGTDAQRSYVRATGTASTINRAFSVRLRLYPATARVNAGPYRLRANDRAVTIPASLAGGVLGVTGLDNAAPVSTMALPSARPAGPAAQPKPAAARQAPCSHYYGQHLATGLPRHYGRSTFPTQVCGYSARQLRSAYGFSGANTGRGQTMALVELGLTPRMFHTLRLYASASGIPAPSARQYSELPIGRAKLCADVFNVEEQLDVEAAYDMAPGAHQLVVGGDACDIGDFGLQGLFDANIAILNGAANHPLASAASNSWEGGDESQPADDTSIEHAFLVRAAAEGVGMYFSTGDFSGLFTPSSDPFATGVGGTTLGLGKAGDRLFETGWSTAQNLVNGKKWVIFGELGAAGGGASLLWNQPGYQAGVVPAALATVPGNRGGPVRSAPDISADADPFTGMAVGLLKSHRHKPATFGFIRVAGTSLAAPLVAGMVMAAQQGQPAAFGFLNPVLYRLPGTGALRDVLPLTARTNSLYRGVSCDARACGQQLLTTFDEQSPRMLGYFGQVALKGYDNMSGVGTPAGQRFISVLRRLALADGAVASLEEGSPSG